MKKKNVLFVCNMGVNRSATADLLLKNNKGYKTRHAGSGLLAFKKISSRAIKWADIIICMEKHNKNIILMKFLKESKNKEFHVLNVRDFYIRGNKKLIKILKKKLSRILKMKFRDKDY